MGLDIGGTLAKLVFFESEDRPSWCDGRVSQVIRGLGVAAERPSVQPISPSCKSELSEFGDHRGFSRQGSFWGEQDKELCFYDAELKGHFHFICFRSDQMERFVSLLSEHELHHDITEIFTTGGGAYKYAQLFKERLGITLQPVDELGVVIKGISWLVKRSIQQEICWLGEQTVFQQGHHLESECHYLDPEQDLFPFILVNIGSGVSVVKVEGIDKFERISGSALGGGTYWGLCKLLCPECKDFSQASCLAAEGDSSQVNLLVEDIYGGDYELPSGAKLPGSLVASFFAKAGRAERSDAPPALLHALTTMVSQNICQIAYLNARLHSVSRIIFTGNFLRQNTLARQVIAENMRRVSTALQGRQQFQALFLHHEGYFGALGSFLHNVEEHHAVAMCKRPSDLGVAFGETYEESRPRSCCSALLSMRQHVVQRWMNIKDFGASSKCPDTSPRSPLSKGLGGAV